MRRIIALVFYLLGAVAVTTFSIHERSPIDAIAIAEASNDGVRGVPLGLMDPVYPNGVAPTEKEISIGRALFFDPILSANGTVSCGSCHKPEHAFTDPRQVSLGVGGTPGSRNSMTVLNAAFFSEFGWDGHNKSLEEQTLEAISNPDEMALPVELIEAKISRRYGNELKDLYGDSSAESVARALADYQRTLISGNSAFDRYIYDDDADAISESAKRGFETFLRRGRCIQCHMVRCEKCHPFGGITGFFMNNRYHNIGVGLEDGESTPSDVGRYVVTGDPEDMGAFKTPSLRNVALTAPYMHDGSLATLMDVVDHYDQGGTPNPNLDQEIQPLNLSEQEKLDLVEFLKSLTSEEYAVGQPTDAI